MASSSLRRCPTNPTPRSFKSSAVKLGRTVSSILFSRNAASYCSRPSLRSQPPTSMAAPLFVRALHDPPGETACLGNADDRFGSFSTEFACAACHLMSALPQRRANEPVPLVRTRRRIGDLRRQRQRWTRRRLRLGGGPGRGPHVDRRRQRRDLRLACDGRRRRIDDGGRRRARHRRLLRAEAGADRGRAFWFTGALGSAASGIAGLSIRRQHDRRRRRRRRLAALDRIEPSGFVIDRPHRQPRRQRRNVDAAAQRVGRADGEQLDFRTAGRRPAIVRRARRGCRPDRRGYRIRRR